MKAIDRGIAALMVAALLYLAAHIVIAVIAGPPLDSSSDGRYHTCGYVTEQGVTEHLAVYWDRCGKSTP